MLHNLFDFHIPLTSFILVKWNKTGYSVYNARTLILSIIWRHTVKVKLLLIYHCNKHTVKCPCDSILFNNSSSSSSNNRHHNSFWHLFNRLSVL